MPEDPKARDTWAELADRFVDGHYGSLRGRVRTYVIDQQLRGHLPAPPARIVDVGGGAGHQSIPLARDGYEVTIADPSRAMLGRAEQLLSREPSDVARRVRLVEVAADGAAGLLGDSGFDAVLCHGVIMYVEDPGPFVGHLVRLATPGALVSIVAKNAANLAVRPALEGRWTDALDAFCGVRQVNGLGVDTRADTVFDLTRLLKAAGVETLAWYGVRLFTDGWTRDMPPADSEAEVLAVELEASRRDPYRQMSRLFHLVGNKAACSP